MIHSIYSIFFDDSFKFNQKSDFCKSIYAYYLYDFFLLEAETQFYIKIKIACPKKTYFFCLFNESFQAKGYKKLSLIFKNTTKKNLKKCIYNHNLMQRGPINVIEFRQFNK